MDARRPRGGLDLGVRRSPATLRDRLASGDVREQRVLWEHADRVVHRLERGVAKVPAVDEDAPLRGVGEADEQPGERRLARPARSDQGRDLPRTYDEADVPRGVGVCARMAVSDPDELDEAATGLWQGPACGASTTLGFCSSSSITRSAPAAAAKTSCKIWPSDRLRRLPASQGRPASDHHGPRHGLRTQGKPDARPGTRVKGVPRRT